MKVEKLLRDHNVPIAEPGDENHRDGWVNVRCPFCADSSKHLGIHRFVNRANCWRCGWHPLKAAISKVIGVSEPEAARIMKDYGGKSRGTKTEKVKPKIRLKEHKLPSDCGPLKKRHKRYLLSRNFDPNYLEDQWKLLASGPLSKLGEIEYKHRIVAPIYWGGERVSFQARDVTGKQKLKYKACPKDRELIEHQNILYGDQNKWIDLGIIVEGITDVWRLGPLAAATFGIDFTNRQVRQIAKHFKRVVIIYDDEPQAQRQAKKLQDKLIIRGIPAWIETIDGDPGDLTQEAANKLVKKMLALYNN